MSRLRVIVLDSEVPGAWRYLLWADVPRERQIFYKSTGVSQWKDALPEDNTNLQSGSVTEQSGQINIVGFTRTELELELQSRWSNFQDAVTARDPWIFYGSRWDGLTWTSTGVA